MRDESRFYCFRVAGRGGYKQADGIVVARLCGTSRRLSFEHAADDAAVAELQAITSRVDLLSEAAGVCMAQHRYSAAVHPFARRAADLLFAAGADLGLAEKQAALSLDSLGADRP